MTKKLPDWYWRIRVVFRRVVPGFVGPKRLPCCMGVVFSLLSLFVFVCVFFGFPISPLKRNLSSAESSIFLYFVEGFFGILTPMQEIIDHFNSHAAWRSLFSCFFSFLEVDLSGVHFSRKTVQREYQSGKAFFGSFWLPAGHRGSIEFARRFASKVGFG